MVISISRVGYYHDNAVAESIIAKLKNELTLQHDLKTRSDAKSAIFDYIEIVYNRKRPHQSLNYATTVVYETMRAVAVKKNHGQFFLIYLPQYLIIKQQRLLI